MEAIKSDSQFRAWNDDGSPLAPEQESFAARVRHQRMLLEVDRMLDRYLVANADGSVAVGQIWYDFGIGERTLLDCIERRDISVSIEIDESKQDGKKRKLVRGIAWSRPALLAGLLRRTILTPALAKA